MTSQTSALMQVRRSLDREHVAWALFGSVIVAVYDPNRRVHDVDILVPDSALHHVANKLDTTVNVGPHDQPLIQVAGIEIYGALHIQTNVGLHVFTLDEEMISRREYVHIDSTKVPTISREDHIVLKAILQRGPGLGKLDIQDILTLSRLGPLDTQYIQRRIERCAAQGRADELLRRLGILQGFP